MQALLLRQCCTLGQCIRLSLGQAGIHHRVDLECREHSPSCPGLVMYMSPPSSVKMSAGFIGKATPLAIRQQLDCTEEVLSLDEHHQKTTSLFSFNNVIMSKQSNKILCNVDTKKMSPPHLSLQGSTLI